MIIHYSLQIIDSATHVDIWSADIDYNSALCGKTTSLPQSKTTR